jgi:hypothetical protein
MHPLFNATAAFVVGAAATYLLGRAILRRRVRLPLTDAQVRESVRSRLPDLVSHPEAIHVAVQAGVVRVSGRVLSREINGFLMRLTDLPGVYKVYNALSTLDDLGALDEVQDIERRSDLQS